MRSHAGRRHPLRPQRWWALAALLALTPLGSVSAHATKPLPRVTISGKVLLGDTKAFRTVATVDRRKVFDAIPAVRTLRTEKVVRDSARYHFLIYEANREFQRVVGLAALRQSIDLVVEVGGVLAAGIDIIDLTPATMAVLTPGGRS